MRSMWSLTRLSWFQLDLFPAPAFLLLLCINYSFEIVVLIVDDTVYLVVLVQIVYHDDQHTSSESCMPACMMIDLAGIASH